MKKLLTLLLLAVSLLPAPLTAQTKEPALVFTHVTVVDVASGRAKPDTTVVVGGARIVALDRSGKVKVPRGGQVIDASGKFLIPGLWDMHAHSLTDNRYKWVFPLLIANGVTGVRELGTDLPYERINQIRREILEGKLLGPRFGAATARILDGKGSAINVPMVVETADEARRLVREYHRHGMDFIKPYNLLSREVYLAIVDEAKRQKIPFAGHVPFSMTAAEVSDLGQISIEHFTDIFLSCSRDEAKLRRERQELAKTSPVGPGPLIETKAAATYDERKAAALFARFARNGTWVCPTIVFYLPVITEESKRASDDRLKYIPAPTEERWRNQLKQRTESVNLSDRKALHPKRLEIVRLMHRTGVRLLAGTDILNPYLYPGFSLHDELELFVEAGLSPLEALRTATINPARFFGREKEFGTVERGKLADLVLLEASPLEDISNTRRISAVVAGGRYLSKETLQKLLAEAEAAANRVNPR